ncbi:MAG TPA: right-handed parallel beta-helix repeat-containing protein, partial [Granulicella sp.]
MIQVPGDVSTVQAAIDMASNGDTVNIAPETYPETINFHGKSITVQGSALGVILKGSQNGPVVTFNSGETRSAVLQNVTVTNGAALAGQSAGGIFINKASPTIQNSTIQDNKVIGIGVFNGAPYLLNNDIRGTVFDPISNTCGSGVINYGGGILLCGASNLGVETQIVGNVIEDNQAMFGGAGINVISAGQPLIENNTIRDNVTNDRGAGIYIEGDTAPFILQNLIYSNTINPTLIAPAYTDVGAGLNVDVSSIQFASTPILIVNNTIVENELLLVSGARSQGSQVFVSKNSQPVRLTNNLIVGTTSQSAIDCYQDPTHPVAPPSFDHNDVYNLNYPGVAVFSGTCSNQTGISGNISADPLFASNETDVN